MHKAQAKLDKARAAEADKQAKKTAQEQARIERARRSTDAARDRQVASLHGGLQEARALIDSRPWDAIPEKITVLFLTADPDGAPPLHIDREIRLIQERVRSSQLRDSIAFEYRHAVRVTDLIQHLNEVQPDVVHFSGHGEDAGLVLHDTDDSERVLSNDQLAGVLDAAPKPIKLAVFNSCDSAEQARVAVQHVKAAIGMEETIEDRQRARLRRTALQLARIRAAAWTCVRAGVPTGRADVRGRVRNAERWPPPTGSTPMT